MILRGKSGVVTWCVTPPRVAAVERRVSGLRTAQKGLPRDHVHNADERPVRDEGIAPAGHRPRRPAESLLTGPAGIR